MASSATGGAKGQPIDVLVMATKDAGCDFKPMRMQRRPCGAEDVVIDMKYCGICHTDLHTAAGHVGLMGTSRYPCVPGHELAGVCVAVGERVTRVRVGDHIGVGCMVDSCLNCAACRDGREQHCTKQIGTYGYKDVSGRAATYPLGGHTLGGYTSAFVVHERFAVIIPKSYPLECAGPVMCAGVTLFDPLRVFGATAGTRVGIIGVGGLGQMGLKLAKAMGCTTTAITRSASKAAFAKEKCGADAVLVSTDAAAMAAAAGSLDLILNTIPVQHDYTVYAALLDRRNRRARQVLLGLTNDLVAGLVVSGLTCGASRVTSSGIGGIEATQAVIDLCDKHGIKPEIKIIPVEGINAAYEALDRSNESAERYVLDLAGSLNDAAFQRCATVPPPALGPAPPGLTGCGVIGAIMSMLCCCKWR